MTVYTRRFGLVYNPTGSGQDVFIADDAYVYVLRDVTLHNRGVSALPYIGISSGGLLAILEQKTVAQNETLRWEGRQVLDPGDALSVAGGGSAYTVVATGYALTKGP